MKNKITRLLLLLAAALFFMNGTCDSDDSADPVPTTGNSLEGFLCTMGLTFTGISDTIVYYYNTGSSGNMHEYAKEYAVDRDKIRFEPQGSNSNIYEIKFEEPYKNTDGSIKHYYLGVSGELIDKKEYPVGVKYRMESKLESSPDTKFRIIYDDGHFTIESESHPGYYLAAVKWSYATYPGTTDLVFYNSPQSFFFLQ